MIELRNYPSPQPKNLQVGSKTPRPPHVPSYLPPFPDSHTYIRTPVRYDKFNNIVYYFIMSRHSLVLKRIIAQ